MLRQVTQQGLLTVMAAGFIVSCASPSPTKISQSDLSFFDRGSRFDQSHRPIEIDNDTIVLDTRPFFEYQISHVPGAIHVDSGEFHLMGLSGNALEEKAQDLTRRLALYGVTPFSHVVVFGGGMSGDGREGRVALSLLVLGVERVQVGQIDRFKKLLKSSVSPSKENRRYWQPRLLTSIFCVGPKDKSLVLERAPRKKQKAKSLSWKDFVKATMAPDKSISRQLSARGVEAQTKVSVSGQGAPMAVFSLLRQGYQKACLLQPPR